MKAYWTKRTHLFRRDEYICSQCGSASVKPYRSCPVCKADCARPGQKAVMGRVKYDATWVDEAECMAAIVDDDW